MALAKRRLACENTRFQVFLDDIVGAGGSTINDYLVVAPKYRGADLVTGVAVLPICDGKIGLLKVYRHAIDAESWEIPRGFIDEGETDQALAALRELEEETGLSCHRDQVRSLGLVTPEPGVLAARVHVYVALQCTSTRPYVPAEFGHLEFRLFDPPEVEELILRSEVQDPCTAIAYYKYGHRNCYP